MEDLVISNDRVVGRFNYHGTHRGDLMGIPATGNSVEMRSIDIWRVKEGMFAEHWDELNLMEVFQQVGAGPPRGLAPEGEDHGSRCGDSADEIDHQREVVNP